MCLSTGPPSDKMAWGSLISPTVWTGLATVSDFAGVEFTPGWATTHDPCLLVSATDTEGNQQESLSGNMSMTRPGSS